MEGSVRDFAMYRLEMAREDLQRARNAMQQEDYKLLMNRSYYAIFHSLRAVNALDGFDSSKHKGVISHFNKEHVKTGEFPAEISKKEPQGSFLFNMLHKCIPFRIPKIKLTTSRCFTIIF
ncbi:MAG: HEPN domain-containing protein [Lachnospiraceae bacterium]|nr:HEPN domain-containing protein [Lachnospiraceae bacterium]